MHILTKYLSKTTYLYTFRLRNKDKCFAVSAENPRGKLFKQGKKDRLLPLVKGRI